jgi:hypothetical protein
MLAGLTAEARNAGISRNRTVTPSVRSDANATTRQSTLRNRRTELSGGLKLDQHKRFAPPRKQCASGRCTEGGHRAFRLHQLDEAWTSRADGDAQSDLPHVRAMRSIIQDQVEHREPRGLADSRSCPSSKTTSRLTSLSSSCIRTWNSRRRRVTHRACPCCRSRR